MISCTTSIHALTGADIEGGGGSGPPTAPPEQIRRRPGPIVCNILIEVKSAFGSLYYNLESIAGGPKITVWGRGGGAMAWVYSFLPVFIFN